MAALGGFTDITGAQNSIDIENLARFAVDEHNKKEVLYYYFFLFSSFKSTFNYNLIQILWFMLIWCAGSFHDHVIWESKVGLVSFCSSDTWLTESCSDYD